VGTQRCNDFVRRTVTSQDNALDSGPDSTHFSQQRQVFCNFAIAVGDHHTEGPHAKSQQSIGMSCCVFHRHIGGREYSANLAA
jgi:hypothetical protein